MNFKGQKKATGIPVIWEWKVYKNSITYGPSRFNDDSLMINTAL